MRRNVTACFLMLLVAIVCVSGRASGQSPWVDPDGVLPGLPKAQASQIILTMSPTITLEPVTVGEILGADSGVRDAGFVQLTPGFGMSAMAPDPSGGSAFTTAVSRSTDLVFRAWVERARGNLADLQIDYELFGTTGIADRLDHRQDPASYMGVAVLPVGPWEVQKQGRWRLIQAGAAFQLDLSNVTRSGPYEGTLSVVINSL